MDQATQGQVVLDQTQTLQSVTGSLAAYYDFENDKKVNKHILPDPQDFTLLTRFTGWDGFLFKWGTEERYGLIYQSTVQPDTYMVAFRGTDSDMDAWEDVWFSTDTFQQYQGTGLPTGVDVSSGFYSVYTGQGGGMTQSMREQVFGFLQKASPAPKKVLIAGHSLGAAVANLFALDMAASWPHVEVVNTTIASPRVGKSAWQSVYNDHYQLLGRTFRIANHYDWVPSLPPHTLFDFDHVGQRFLVAFYLETPFYPAPLSWHSLLNYQTVLQHALPASPQVWKGHFKDHASAYIFHTIYSVVPNTSVADAEWEGELRKVHDLHNQSCASS